MCRYERLSDNCPNERCELELYPAIICNFCIFIFIEEGVMLCASTTTFDFTVSFAVVYTHTHTHLHTPTHTHI